LNMKTAQPVCLLPLQAMHTAQTVLKFKWIRQLVVENDALTVCEYEMTEQEFSKTNIKPFGHVNAETYKVETAEENPAHVGVLNAWADAVLHGGKLIADGREGINGLSLSNAMHLSSFLNQEITLPLDDELYYNELEKRIARSKKK